MYLVTTVMCPSRGCGAVTPVYLAAEQAPAWNASYEYICPRCRSRVLFPVQGTSAADALPENATFAQKRGS